MIAMTHIVIPVILSKSKKNGFLKCMSKSIVPIKEIKRCLGNRLYYHLRDKCEEINNILEIEGFEKIFNFDLGKDSINGREVKVLRFNHDFKIGESDNMAYFVFNIRGE
ncbi:hypothetical protein ACFLZN_02400 [Nanoarchaeota archaeon]